MSLAWLWLVFVFCFACLWFVSGLIIAWLWLALVRIWLVPVSFLVCSWMVSLWFAYGLLLACFWLDPVACLLFVSGFNLARLRPVSSSPVACAGLSLACLLLVFFASSMACLRCSLLLCDGSLLISATLCCSLLLSNAFVCLC